MLNDYYFSFEEPVLFDKKIVCAFYIDEIENKRGFFFIVEENNQYSLYYSIISSSELLNIVKEYEKTLHIDENISFTEIIESNDFRKYFNEKYLGYKILNNNSYISNIFERMNKDDIYNSNNKSYGLDGFSVELKINKGKDYFYSWCISKEKEYFYILDFINFILDEISINKKYRFEKVD